jgi:phosphohistidine swiveling domain-containing protein
MNFEFTDRAFEYQDKNPVIKKNLAAVAKFKDAHVRTMINTVLFEPDGYAAQVFSKLARQFNISSATIENLTSSEILRLFDDWRPNIRQVAKRQKAFVEDYNVNGNFLEGKSATVILREFTGQTVNDKKGIIRGKTASNGHAIGQVKIIPVDYGNLENVDREIEKMNTGNILVAETTAPELMAACRKAAAIITDVGGLLSHAAIVSREFGIPCIVATENASKILKDGDLVEVNGVDGTIRMLNKEGR